MIELIAGENKQKNSAEKAFLGGDFFLFLFVCFEYSHQQSKVSPNLVL